MANAVDAVAAFQASETPIARPLDETRENTDGSERERHATSPQSPKHATAIGPDSDTERPAEATPRVSTDDEARPVPLREHLLDATPRTGDLPSSQAIESAPVDALLGEEASSVFGVVPAALVPRVADLMSDVLRFDVQSFERGMQAFLDQLAALAAQLSGPARLEVNSRIVALAVVLTGLGLEVARRGARKRKAEAGSPLPTMGPMSSWAWGLTHFPPGAENHEGAVGQLTGKTVQR
jgi:hypothetical protein